MRMISEQDEFLLSQLLDGDLDAASAEALQKRIELEPALRETLTELERVNALLTVRRADQPVVELGRMRADIMDAVELSRRPSIIRMPAWRWAGGLVAAAAAIALFFVVYRPSPQVGRPAPTPLARNNVQPPAVAPVTPAPGGDSNQTAPVHKSERMLVQFNRPGGAAPAGGMRVSYIRSPDLADAMKARDTERRSRPKWHLYMAERTPTRKAVILSPFDAPL